LGLLYFEGHGVPQDFVQALRWCVIARATDGSSPTIDQNLQIILDLVTPSQIAQAEKLASEWWAEHHH
jgi:hypothetical protein